MYATKLESMDVTEHETPLNPFNQDLFHMGSYLHRNIAVMAPEFEFACTEYIIIINRFTGERLMITTGCETSIDETGAPVCKQHGKSKKTV